MQVQGPNTQSETRTAGLFFRKLFQNLFYLHIFLITILIIFFTIHGLLSTAHTHRFRPRKWYPPLLASTACAGIVAFSWQWITHCNPAKAIKAAFWLGPLLTCGVGVLLVAIGSAGSLAAAAVALVSALIQSLYSCWVNPRFDHAIKVLSVSTAFPPAKTTFLVILSIITCTLYSSFLVVGIGGTTATGTSLDVLFILVILLSLAWTMHVIKNTLQVTISRVKYMNFACGIDFDTRVAFCDTIKHSIGSVYVGSALVPVLGLIRGSARAMSLVSGDADEFMFSCANCYSGVASRLVTYGNRWGFVHVGVYNKGFVQASMDTWGIFGRVGLKPLIDSDLTSSFCFLCGVAGGAVCTLVGGSWTLVVHKAYATEVSIYAFLIGYFMVRSEHVSITKNYSNVKNLKKRLTSILMLSCRLGLPWRGRKLVFLHTLLLMQRTQRALGLARLSQIAFKSYSDIELSRSRNPIY
uniref:Choline transporter-like protein n=1 Tax=Davidia involucrata TaxID=16924 RepID=A0A5B7B4B7_DAVIN